MIQKCIDFFVLIAMPENCHELYKQGLSKSGVYNICPWDMCDLNFRCVDAFCDMHTDGGGWTVSILVIIFLSYMYTSPLFPPYFK